MEANERIQVGIMRPDDPEKVIMDKTVYKTETEWWAYKKIELLNIVVKTVQQKVKDEFDHGKAVATALQAEITFLNHKINVLMDEQEKAKKEKNKTVQYIKSVHDKNAMLYLGNKKLEAENKKLEAENKKLERTNARLSRPQDISLDELMMMLTDSDIKKISKATEYYS